MAILRVLMHKLRVLLDPDYGHSLGCNDIKSRQIVLIPEALRLIWYHVVAARDVGKDTLFFVAFPLVLYHLSGAFFVLAVAMFAHDVVAARDAGKDGCIQPPLCCSRHPFLSWPPSFGCILKLMVLPVFAHA